MPVGDEASQPARRITRRFWSAVAVVFLLFAVYGSLVPFHLRHIPPVVALRTYPGVIGHPLQLRLSRTDLVANILLFVPIGFCLTGAFRLDRHRWWTGPAAAAGVLGISLPWSVLIEFLQVFTTDRTPSVGDVAAQTLGCLAGVVAWEAFGSPVTWWMRSTLAARTRVERLERLLALYACAWAAVNLAPFDITLDIGTLIAKLRGGGIQLYPVPFTWPGGPWGPWVWDAAVSALAAVPLGVLAVIGFTEEGRRRAWTRAARLVVSGLLLVESAQVFVASHAADVNDLLFGCLGAGVGLWLASRWSARQLAEGPPRDRARSWALAGVLGWCLVMVTYHWMPFDFRLDGRMVRERLASMSPVPFAAYRAGSDLGALDQVLVKASLALPLGVLCGLASPPVSRRRRLLVVAAWLAGAAAWLAVVEAGQLLLPSRVADPTDVLVGVLGVWVGLALADWIRRGR